jgi:hypothetical protein
MVVMLLDSHVITPTVVSADILIVFVSPLAAQSIPVPVPTQGNAEVLQSDVAVIVIIVFAAIALSEFNENIEKNNIKSDFNFILTKRFNFINFS